MSTRAEAAAVASFLGPQKKRGTEWCWYCSGWHHVHSGGGDHMVSGKNTGGQFPNMESRDQLLSAAKTYRNLTDIFEQVEFVDIRVLMSSSFFPFICLSSSPFLPLQCFLLILISVHEPFIFFLLCSVIAVEIE